MTPGSVFQDPLVRPIWPHSENVLKFIIFTSVLSVMGDKLNALLFMYIM